jgi:protein-tyrosine phosphatase
MKVLFVCDGNICRSPYAAEYFRDRAVQSGLSHVVVASGGLLGIEGAPAAPFSIEIARETGLDLTRHRSRGITLSDVKTSDLILAMTLTHLETLERRFPPTHGKQLLLRAFEVGPSARGGAPELPDPVAGPIEEYREAFGVIRTCVDHLVLHLRNAP